MITPLAGIKVIEIGQAYAGPLAGAILSDMGAEIIKVEKPDGGDDARLWGPPFIEGDSGDCCVARTQPLSERDDVGVYTPVFGREQSSGATHAGHHFIGDQ